MLALVLAPSAISARANPTGPTIVNGQVTMNQAGNLLSITNSPNSIVNWQSFSIGANEITRFTQQSAASAVLNRVVGAGGSIDPSVILGALQSNGRVFLLNPSGIVFGAGSQIDVAGLVASSLNLSNADFLGGRLRFTEVPGAGAVVNQGSITAASGGQVYLVGPSVTNSGIITSPQGEVILAAGNSVELVNPGTPNLRVEITAPDNEARNLGSIVADAGRVGIYAGLVTHSGTIRADSAVATEDGRIVLKATRNVSLEAGSVTSTNGGRIDVEAGDAIQMAGTVEAKGTSEQRGLVQLRGNTVSVMGPIAAAGDFTITAGEFALMGPLNVSGFFGASTVDFTTNAALTVGGHLSLSGINFTFNGPLSVGGNALVSGTTIISNAPVMVGGNLAETANTISTGAAMHVGGALDVATTSLSITAPVDAQRVTFNTNSLVLTDTVTAASSIDIARSRNELGGTIEVGAATPGPHNILYLTGAQVNTLLKAPTLQIGGQTTFTINVVGPIAPTGPNAPGALVLQTAPFSTGINVSAPILTAAPGDILLSSGSVNVTGSGSLTTNAGSIDICCGNTTIAGPVTANDGSISIAAQSLNTSAPLLARSGITLSASNGLGIHAPVRTTGLDGDINVRPSDFSATPVLDEEFFGRFAPGSGVLRIGDSSTRSDLLLAGQILGTGLTTLSLITGRGGVTQMPGSTISVPNLAVQADWTIALDGNNLASTVTLHSTRGDVGYRYAGAGPLTVGNVDPAFVAPGIAAGPSGSVVLRSNGISINENVTGNKVVLVPHTAGTAIALGTKPADMLGVTATELGRIHASTLAAGDASSGDVAVTGPVSGSAGTFTNLLVETQPSSSFKVNAAGPLTVPGNIGIVAGAVVADSDMSSLHGSISISADAMTFNAGINANAPSGTIVLAQRSAATTINLGGRDVASSFPTLGLDATDTGNLHSGMLEIGNSATASIAVHAPTHLDALSAKLTARPGGAMTVDSKLDNTGNLTLSGTGNVGITANGTLATTAGGLSVEAGSIASDGLLAASDYLTLSVLPHGSIVANGTMSSAGHLDLFVPGNGSISVNGSLSALGNTALTADTIAITGGNISGANVTLNTAGGGRIVNLGTLTTGASFALDQAALGRITTPGTLTISSGTLNVTSPVSFTNLSNLSLRANTMDVTPAGSVTINGPGGVIAVSPWYYNTMRLGGTGGLDGLELSNAEINRFVVPNGVLRLGDLSTTGQMRIEGPISFDPGNVKTLTLAASRESGGGMTQTANSTITVSNLRLQTIGAIDLTENNAVGTLAGGNIGGSYSFTNVGTLAVGGVVDGVAGLQGGNLILRADDLMISGPGTIGNFSVTLAPRLTGAAMNLGASPGGAFGVDAAEMAHVTGGGLLAFGTNTTGPVTVSAAMERSSGGLGIFTAPDQAVDVNGALSAPSGIQIDAGTINVSQPITSSSVTLTARAPGALNIDSVLSASGGGSVTLQAQGDMAFNGPNARIAAAAGTAELTSTGGSITSDEEAFLAPAAVDIVAASTRLSAFGSVGSIASPIMTRTSELSVKSGGIYFSILNEGDLTLSLLTTSAGMGQIRTTGAMQLAAPIHLSSAGFGLQGNAGLTIDRNVSAGGIVALSGGAGDLNVRGTTILGSILNMSGRNVNIGDASSTVPTTVNASIVRVSAQGDLTVQGGAVDGAAAVLNAASGLDATTGGDIRVQGGTAAGANAVLAGTKMHLAVGGAVKVATGADMNANARIESPLQGSMALDFPVTAPFGYFVNGREGVLVSGASGFFASGQPATVPAGLLVNYGSFSQPDFPSVGFNPFVPTTEGLELEAKRNIGIGNAGIDDAGGGASKAMERASTVLTTETNRVLSTGYMLLPETAPRRRAEEEPQP